MQFPPVQSDDHANVRIAGVLEDVMAAGDTVDEETAALKDTDDVAWGERGDPRTHARARSTVTCSCTTLSRTSSGAG